MKRANTSGLMALMLVAMSLFTAPADRPAEYGTGKEARQGVTCRTWDTASHTYPADNARYWVCETSSETVSLKCEDLVATLEEGRQNTGVNAFLKNHNVYY